MTTNLNVSSGIPAKKLSPTNTSYESETEDEEVRMNCIAGCRFVDESGINTTDESDSEEDIEETFAVVQFVKTPPTYLTCVPLVYPKATIPNANRNLSPHSEVDSLSAPDEMGARHHDFRDNIILAMEASENDDSGIAIFGAASSNTFHLLVDCDDDSFELNSNMIACLFDGTETHGSLFGIIESSGETCDIMFDDSESSDTHCIGVRVDCEPEKSRLSQVKRSGSTMLALDNHFMEHTKRTKRFSPKESNVLVKEAFTSILNESAFPSEVLSYVCSRSVRNNTPDLLTNDDEDLDRQLGEELVENYDTDEERDGTPVPLLTPPGSPVTVEWEGNHATVCEWPSNLIVDIAMQAINELRPMSPDSLESLERYELSRVESMFSVVPATGGSLLQCVRA